MGVHSSASRATKADAKLPWYYITANVGGRSGFRDVKTQGHAPHGSVSAEDAVPGRAFSVSGTVLSMMDLETYNGGVTCRIP